MNARTLQLVSNCSRYRKRRGRTCPFSIYYSFQCFGRTARIDCLTVYADYASINCLHVIFISGMNIRSKHPRLCGRSHSSDSITRDDGVTRCVVTLQTKCGDHHCDSERSKKWQQQTTRTRETCVGACDANVVSKWKLETEENGANERR